jgi:Mg-chelatase subunit ChlD
MDTNMNTANGLQITINNTPTDTSSTTDTIVSIKSSDSNTRLPLDIVVVIDVSGSMNGDASIKGKESSGLNILDIVKYSTRTIAEVLSKNDRLAIVKYSNNASVVLDLIEMDDTGKQKANTVLDALQPGGMTNLWDGLHKGLDILTRRTSRKQVNSAIYVLTDGVPSEHPPSGYIPTLQNYRDSNGGKYPGIVSTFGFGYSLESPLLESIARECNGTYSFIPDSGFVGTVFEHAIANTLVTRAVNVYLSIEPSNGTVILDDYIGGIDGIKQSWGLRINVGNILFGQSRDFVLKLSAMDGVPSINTTLEYIDLTNNSKSERMVQRNSTIIERNIELNFHISRQHIISLIKHIMSTKERDILETQVISLSSHISASLKDKGVGELLKDLDGQIKEAIRVIDFQRWGRHYLPSLRRAHELQQCNNFKDPGVQSYGGHLFGTIRDEADDIFLNRIPPPVPSVRVYSRNINVATTPVAMSGFSSRDNPCFHGLSKVLMFNGIYKHASDIVKGDYVKLSNSDNNEKPGIIECVVKTVIHDNSIKLKKLSDGLIVTYWHPVKIDNTWQFPYHVKNASECNIKCDAIYSFILKRDDNSRGNGKGMMIGGIECATLGHGIVDNDVIKHPYFGTEEVIKNLKTSSNTYETGLITLNQNCTVRNNDTGYVHEIVV